MHQIKRSSKHVTKKNYPYHRYQFHFPYVISYSFIVLFSALLIFEEEIAKLRIKITTQVSSKISEIKIKIELKVIRLKSRAANPQ